MITNPIVLRRVEQYMDALKASYTSRGYGALSHNYHLENRKGAKYHRIVMTSEGSRSVHAFVDADGLLYKSEGWKTPAKDARFDLLDADSFAALLKVADWAGGALYRGVAGQLPKGYTVADRPSAWVGCFPAAPQERDEPAEMTAVLGPKVRRTPSKSRKRVVVA